MRHSFQRVDFFSTIAALLEEETPAFTHSSKQTFFCKHYKTLVRFEKAFFYPIHICTAANTTMKRHTFAAYYCFAPCILNRTYFRLKCVGLYINRICPNIPAIGRDSFRKFFDLSTPTRGYVNVHFARLAKSSFPFRW